jgi:hypothetical protein
MPNKLHAGVTRVEHERAIQAVGARKQVERDAAEQRRRGGVQSSLQDVCVPYPHLGGAPCCSGEQHRG